MASGNHSRIINSHGQDGKGKGRFIRSSDTLSGICHPQAAPHYTEKTFRIQGKKIINVAGVHHELDVWVSVELGYGYDAVFIFECKNWQKKVTKNDLIVFSEKIKAAQAQKGFFVAKAFTRDAKAQAKADPRIRLLHVREVDFAEVPICLQYFHLIEQTDCHAECNVKLKTAQEAGETRPLDMSTAKLILEGEAQGLSTYIEKWQKGLVEKTLNRFRTEKLPEGTYTLPFEELRAFEDGICFVNDESVAHMKLTGNVEVRVWRAEMESRFEVENRGRVYRALVNMPSGQVVLATHELITAIPESNR